MFNKVFVEKDSLEHPRAKHILEKLKVSAPTEIDKIDHIFGKVKKPYLQKRDNLNLFIGQKKGQLVKEAPLAYGLSGEPHYYFVHAYNCIYECNYCYLQGYFNSPDIVLFINYEEIGKEIERITNSFPPNKTVWFHAGEYSDSLALSHITNEVPYYFELFEQLPNAKLEIRTKSVNIKELLAQSPLDNIITSFSLSPAHRIKRNDLKTPSLKARLNALEMLAAKGHRLGIHLDPIIFEENFEAHYNELLNELFKRVPVDLIEYISLGVVRFSKDVYYQVSQNYPDSDFMAGDFIKSFDGKVRYARPLRLYILKTVKNMCINFGVKEEKIYLCMEGDDS